MNQPAEQALVHGFSQGLDSKVSLGSRGETTSEDADPTVRHDSRKHQDKKQLTLFKHHYLRRAEVQEASNLS